MILVIDNYDSFTYNLVHMLYALEPEIEIKRNREINGTEVLEMHPDALILSPGPGSPGQAGNLEDIISCCTGKIPMLGVCLGHQAIGEVFGAKVVSAIRIVHGKLSEITHDGKGIFEGMRNPFKAVRYHSLALENATLPEFLEVSARSEDGEIMGIRHKNFPIEGIQYHPESIMSSNGKRQISNFIKMAENFNRNGIGKC